MGVVNAGSSPAPALQDSLTGKTSTVLFLQILVVGPLNSWCGGFTAAPQPFTNECGQDYISKIAPILPLLVIRFGRMPAGLQPFMLSILLLLVAALFKEKNHG